jgi:S-adenosylmethionine hydrolase
MNRPIVLLTDFGWRDSYVGQLKAVLASIAPGAAVIDLSHDIEPFAIDEAAWCLETALPVIPPNAVVAAIVDPGVGTSRRGILVEREGRLFVGPDNGVLSPVLPGREGTTGAPADGVHVHEVRSPQFRLPQASATFHGRDIFAPAAAHLSNGVDHRHLGPPVVPDVVLPEFRGRPGGFGELEGYVVHIDRYGNLITTIRAAELFPRFEVSIAGVTIDRHVRTFANVPEGGLLCHADSSGFLAVAVNRGSAAEATGARRGDTVLLRRR